MNLAEKIQSLYAKYGSLKGITIELHKQLVAVSVKNEAASATIFLQGAQVAEYKRVGERPVLWLSEACDFKAGHALRGGVPICWPWFGSLAKNPETVRSQFSDLDSPAHGIVREQEWTLESVELVDSETTQVTLTLDVSPNEIWSYPASLRLSVTIGVELDIQLSVTNTGADPFSFTTALHTYLNLSDVNAVAIKGLEGIDYFDTLDDWQTRKSNLPIVIDKEIDRVYCNVASPVELKDERYKRSIKVSASNAPDLVVWNPWVEKAKRLNHFNDDAYKQMLCLETAHVLDNAVTLLPNACSQFGVRLSIS